MENETVKWTATANTYYYLKTKTGNFTVTKDKIIIIEISPVKCLAYPLYTGISMGTSTQLFGDSNSVEGWVKKGASDSKLGYWTITYRSNNIGEYFWNSITLKTNYQIFNYETGDVVFSGSGYSWQRNGVANSSSPDTIGNTYVFGFNNGGAFKSSFWETILNSISPSISSIQLGIRYISASSVSASTLGINLINGYVPVGTKENFLLGTYNRTE